MNIQNTPPNSQYIKFSSSRRGELISIKWNCYFIIQLSLINIENIWSNINNQPPKNQEKLLYFNNIPLYQ